MALSLISPELLYAWNGPSLLIVNTRGECGSDQSLSGFYLREARFLQTLILDINGQRPWRCEAAANGPTTIALTYVHPEITQPGGGGTGQSGDEVGRDADGLPERSLAIRLTYRVGVADFSILCAIANHAREPLQFEVGWTLSADFADIQEAQFGGREQHGAVDTASKQGQLTFTYRHAQLPFQTEVRHDSCWDVHNGRLVRALTLQPQQCEQLSLRIVPLHPDFILADEEVAEREAMVGGWRTRFTRVEMPGNRLFEQVLACNVRDLGSFPLLQGEPDEWLALQAGMPAYPAFFGRDAVTAGWQGGYVDCGEAVAAALVKLGRLQSDRFDDWRDEQPGRIPYQVRSGPLAMLNVNPYSAYYADYASPLMFVISLANLWAWTGDRRHVERHWDTARRILDWARSYGDMDHDGYLEYQTRSSKGTKNQGWKDSGDAIVYDDGKPVPAPIATCELQGYWYIAQELMALLSWAMGARSDATDYRASAAALKQRFNQDWWIEDEQFIALALDPILPTWLPEIVMRDLRVGDAKVTIRFWRNHDGASKWDVLSRQGTLHIVRQPPLESFSATWMERVADLLQSAAP